jgi:hypothetical protein
MPLTRRSYPSQRGLPVRTMVARRPLESLLSGQSLQRELSREAALSMPLAW